MGNQIFRHSDKKLLLRLNSWALAITALCEVFVVFTFKQKAFTPDLVLWKFIALLAGLIIVSLLFILSIGFFIYFFRQRNN